VNCTHFEALLDSYLDGQLQGTLKLELEAHAVRCERCGHLLGMMDAVGQIIADDVPPVRLPDDFTDRLMGQLQARRPRSRIFFGSAIAASVAVVLTALTWISSPRPVDNALPDSPSGLTVMNTASGTIESSLTVENGIAPTGAAMAGMEPVTLPEWFAHNIYRARDTLIELSTLREAAIHGAREALIQPFVKPARNGPAGPRRGDLADDNRPRPITDPAEADNEAIELI